MKLSMRYGKIVVLIFGLFVQSSDIHAGPVISKLVNSLIESEKFIDNHAGEALIAVVSVVVFYESGKYVRKNLDAHEELMLEEQSKKDSEFCDQLQKEQRSEDLKNESKIKPVITARMLQDAIFIPELEVVSELEREDINLWSYYKTAEDQRIKRIKNQDNCQLPPVRYSDIYYFRPVSPQK